MEKIQNTKIFLGPMSKNIVDTIITFCNNEKKYIGFIPSRRQIEYNGGYVNNWTTKEFYEYIKNKSEYILFERDHGGAGQGLYMDDGYNSLECDTKYCDIIHIDPWKKYPNYEDGLKETIDNIAYCYGKNQKLYFEISTEEAIRPFSPKELDTFLLDLKTYLPIKIYKRIVFVVIQSGTALKNMENTGNYKDTKLQEMLKIVKKYGKLSKEHNGDWMSKEDFISRFQLGLNGLNIAPELGTIETEIILDYIKHSYPEKLKDFYKICYDSGRWKKWVSNDFDPEKNKEKLIKICGHYVFSNPKFLEIKKSLKNVDELIHIELYKKLTEWFSYIN